MKSPLERAAEVLRLSVVHNRTFDPKDAAKAVLTALKEPSEEMETAGVMEGDWNCDNLALGDEAKKVWSAMIDAALKEG
jgi:hypothetical protein